MTDAFARPVWAAPALTVLSLSAVATLASALPASAAAPTAGGVQPATAVAGVTLSNGVPPLLDGTGHAISGQFGEGKEVVYVEAKPGTFPATLTPDFSGLTFGVTQTLTDGTNTQPFSTPCTPHNLFPRGFCATDEPLQLDVPFTIALDGAHSTLPAGFVAPAAASDTIASTLPAAEISSVLSADKVPAACPTPLAQAGDGVVVQCLKGITIQVPGTWRPLGLDLTDKATGKPIAGQRFELHQGSTVLSSAVTDASGHLAFSGLYQGGAFTVVEKTGAPAGLIALAGPQAFAVPAVTTAAQAGKEYDAKVKLAPVAPKALNDSATTNRNQAKVIRVLANDTTAPLTVSSVTKPAHGTAKINPNGTVTYAPARGFTGTDTFRYVARNALGGTAAATVTVRVLGQQVLGERELPVTGAAAAAEANTGLVALAAGMLLVIAGRRRRRTD